MYGVLLSRKLFLRIREKAETVEIARGLKERGMRLILLSNIFVHNSAHYKNKYQFTKLFEKLYFSSDIGFAKPDSRAFELVLRENNLRPEECLFIDDTKRNIEAARRMGIESHLFRGTAGLREFIK